MKPHVREAALGVGAVAVLVTVIWINGNRSSSDRPAENRARSGWNSRLEGEEANSRQNIRSMPAYADLQEAREQVRTTRNELLRQVADEDPQVETAMQAYREARSQLRASWDRLKQRVSPEDLQMLPERTFGGDDRDDEEIGLRPGITDSRPRRRNR